MPTERRPNLFIVGVQKSGTSALAGMLGHHPEVYMSFPKEPGFLAFGADGYPFPDGYGCPAPASEWVVSDARSYLGLFAGATSRHRVLGEASTWYFPLPGMAGRLHDYNPRAKIIVIFRDPADRAYSAWCHARRDKLEPCADFREALSREKTRGEVEFLLRYHFMGRYSASLDEFMRVFDSSALQMLFYEDLRDDPESTWREVCRFLEIDTSLAMPAARGYNRSGQPRSRHVQRLMRSHRLKAISRRIVPLPALLWLKQQVDDVNLRRFPPLDCEIRRELQDYYREDIHALMKLTRRNLDRWLS